MSDDKPRVIQTDMGPVTLKTPVSSWYTEAVKRQAAEQRRDRRQDWEVEYARVMAEKRKAEKSKKPKKSKQT
jgi:hypothetical protein